jgi:cell wall-associated NlpC family hydrolase
MTPANGEAFSIVERAESQLGVPFRLHGRAPGRGLDCIGFAAYSLFGAPGLSEIPVTYRIRGHYEAWLTTELQNFGLIRQSLEEKQGFGDLIVFRPCARQVHLGIVARGGIVHAHAGLRKIVVTPNPPWSVISHWRR